MGNFPDNYFRPYRMSKSQLANFPCKAGQLIFTTDTKRLYIDVTSTASGRLEVSADAIVNADLGTDKRTLTFTKADGSSFSHTIVVDIDGELDTQSINPIQNSAVAIAIEALNLAIAQNSENIGINLNSINGINDSLNIEKGKISTAQTNILNIFEAIQELQNKDGLLEDEIEKNANDIAENLKAIQANSNSISSLETAVDNLGKKDTELQNSIKNTNDELSSFQNTTNNNFITVNSDISKIVSGTTTVKNAENALYANSAITDGNNKNIADTYETKANANSNVSTLKTYAENQAAAALESAKSDASSQVSTHNTSTAAHNDIRSLIEELSNQVNNFLDIDDADRDQLSEVLELIDNNKGTLESLTTNKVNVSDIADDLITPVATKVLSANQGVVLSQDISNLSAIVETKATIQDLNNHVNNTGNPHQVTKEQVGLGNADDTADIDKPVSTAQAIAINEAKSVGELAQTNLDIHIEDKTNPHLVTLSQLGVSTSAAELNLVSGLTSSVQEQLNERALKSEIPTNYAGSSSTAGPAYSAERLENSVTIALGGDASGSVEFDGSNDVTLNVNVQDNSHYHDSSTITGLNDALDGVNNSVASISFSGTNLTYVKNNGQSTSVTLPAMEYEEATTTTAGLMSAQDKVKIDAMPQVVFCTRAQYESYGNSVKNDGKIYFIN